MIYVIDRIASAMAKLTLWLGAALLLVMAVHVTADVLFRHFLHAPIAATLEIGTHYYMVAASFLALGYAQMRDQNVSVDIVIHTAGRKTRMVVECLALMVTLAYAIFFTWASGLTAVEKTSKGEFTLTQFFNLPVWPSRWILVLAGAVFCIVLFAQILILISALARGQDRSVGTLIGSSAKGH